MAGQARLILQHKLTEEVVLNVFKDNQTKLCEISLGNDVKAAKAKAEAIKKVFTDVESIDDRAS